MTLKRLQEKINDIESKYYKGWKQSEEWWRITGNIDPSDRELWIKYNEPVSYTHLTLPTTPYV